MLKARIDGEKLLEAVSLGLISSPLTTDSEATIIGKEDRISVVLSGPSSILTLDIESEVEKTGSVILSKEELRRFCRLIKGDTQLKETRASLILESGTTKLRARKTGTISRTLPSISKETTFKLPSSLICNGISSVMFAVPNKVDRASKRDQLGISISSTNNVLRIEAYQDTCIAQFKAEWEGEDFQAIIPTSLALTIAKANPNSLQLTTTDRIVRATSPGLEILTSLLNTRVRLLDPIVTSRPYSDTLTLDKTSINNLLKAIKDFAALQVTGKRMVGLYLDPVRVSVFIRSRESGSGKVDLDIDYDGTPMKFVVNAGHLIPTLEKLKDREEITIDLAGPRDAMRIQSDELTFTLITDYAGD